MDQEKVCVGLNPSSQIHYTDHLAPLCALLDIPLLFIDDLDFSLGQKYYPGLQAIQVEYTGFNPEMLIENYDVLFLSDLWDRRTFHQKFGALEKRHNKFLRHVHVPHGYSDKTFYLKKCGMEDILLLYGQNMIDMMKQEEVFQNIHRYVISGNFRYTYYKENQEFYDMLVQQEVLNQFAKRQPVILYAPTWLDLEESTTFFDAYSPILDNLPAHYNMIVKLHPRLELDDTALYYHIVGKYEKCPNIVFLNHFTPIYPLLSCTDIYLGDMSSIGYDFLAYNRPMFFLNKFRRDAKHDRRLYLFRCGIEIPPSQYGELYQTIEDNLNKDAVEFTAIRKQVYDYTFGQERPVAQLKTEIQQAYNSEYKG